MRVLYISVLTSRIALKEAISRDSSFGSFAVQKFNRLVAEGLVRNGHSVNALSTFYLPKVGVGYFRRTEAEEGIRFSYIPSFNFHIFRMLWVTIYCFVFVCLWGMYKRNSRVLVFDALNVSACLGGLTASRLLGLKTVGIVTDMPGIGVGNDNTTTDSSLKQVLPLSARINRYYLGKFKYYVFLTEQMNTAINLRHCPYIVLEGLVDVNMKVSDGLKKNKKRIVLYAGGLFERYGLKMLVDAFIQADVADAELWLFGDGPFAEHLPEYHKRDSRIIYRGLRPNHEVVEAELRATLLVNPRPTEEEFTKYSFPSKNMEYMVSGTPVLTTLLPGMPEEYHKHVFLFNKGETVDGYAEVLKSVLALSKEELDVKGKEAREWVLKNKNNISQTARIIHLVES